MKIKGSELQLFMDNGWPGDDWYWDHDVFDDPDPDASYDTDEIGPLMYQGRDRPDLYTVELDLGSLIRKWRKNRDFDPVTVLVPKGNGDAFRELMKVSGYKLG